MSNEAKNETVDPKEHAQAAIVFALRDIARTLRRAADIARTLRRAAGVRSSFDLGCDLAVRAGAKWVSDSGHEATVSHWMPLPKEPTT